MGTLKYFKLIYTETPVNFKQVVQARKDRIDSKKKQPISIYLSNAFRREDLK